MKLKEKLKTCGCIAALGAVLAAGTIVEASAQSRRSNESSKPNVLVIFGDMALSPTWDMDGGCHKWQ